MKNVYEEKRECRVCGSPKLLPILDLGTLRISAFPAPGEEDAPAAPLDLVLCGGECGCLQLRHTTNPDLMYRTYWYRSGTNQTMRNALADICRAVERVAKPKAGDLVVDIGANDGTLLSSYPMGKSLRRVGFEPSNISQEARRHEGVEIINDYFRSGAPGFDGLRGKARAVTSIAMFYDLDDPHSFVKDVDALLAPDGLWIIQIAYLPSMLVKNAFDGICHEHLEYYSLRSVGHLLGMHGFEVFDAELIDINEGSIRLYVRRKGAGPGEAGPSERLRSLLRTEDDLGLATSAPYEAFGKEVERIKEETVAFIRKAKREGKLVHGYGASTKGNTTLQYFGLGPEDVRAIWERQPQKWGRTTTGTRIPIVSEEEGRAAKPDYLLMLPWHFAEEFLQREADYQKKGGKFIIPLPEFRVVP